MATSMMLGKPVRTVWLSDVHLGSPACRVRLLLDFLRRTRCELLYLVGDIIDLESLNRNFYWPDSHTEVLQVLLEKSRQGTRVIYIPGNHDDELRRFDGARFGNIEIAREAIHTTRSGRRLLVLHGDQFDAVVRGKSLRVLLGGLACRSLLKLNRLVHWLHDLAGRPYWSLAQHVKSRFEVAKRYVERFLAHVAARRHGARRLKGSCEHWRYGNTSSRACPDRALRWPLPAILLWHLACRHQNLQSHPIGI